MEDRISFRLNVSTTLTLAHLARRRLDELNADLATFDISDPDRVAFWNVQKDTVSILKAIRRALPPHILSVSNRCFEGIEE